MKLFSMRKFGKESLSPGSVGKFKPDLYSYSHRIELDAGDLAKLGIAAPKVGDVFHVMAHGHVTNVNQHESQNGDKTHNVSLQLKKMGAQKLKKGGSALDAVNSGIKAAQED